MKSLTIATRDLYQLTKVLNSSVSTSSIQQLKAVDVVADALEAPIRPYIVAMESAPENVKNALDDQVGSDPVTVSLEDNAFKYIKDAWQGMGFAPAGRKIRKAFIKIDDAIGKVK